MADGGDPRPAESAFAAMADRAFWDNRNLQNETENFLVDDVFTREAVACFYAMCAVADDAQKIVFQGDLHSILDVYLATLSRDDAVAFLRAYLYSQVDWRDVTARVNARDGRPA